MILQNRFMRRRWSRRARGGEVARGLAAGLIGGLVGSWVMNEFQALVHKASQAAAARRARRIGELPQPELEQPGPETQHESEPVTAEVAALVAKRVFHHDLAAREKKIAEPAVHYIFGTAMGGLYGALAEVAPRVTAGFGLPASTVLWLGADEIALPVLRLSGGPTQYPLSIHLYALVSHWVYGVTVEAVRRGIRHWL